MPKISAATVAEHRANIQESLVDAAERLLRTPGASLTAAAVSAEAGIARNSIYRYVDSVDDLRGLVVARHLPSWQHAVDERVAGIDDPRDLVLTWSLANLEQAAQTGHGWLMELAKGISLPDAAGVDFAEAHGRFATGLRSAWTTLAGARAGLGVDLTRALVDAGFRRLDGGDLLEEVAPVVVASVDGVIGVLAPDRTY